MRERERENMIKSAHIFSSRKCVPRKTNNGNRKGRTDRERRKGLAERKSYIKKKERSKERRREIHRCIDGWIDG